MARSKSPKKTSTKGKKKKAESDVWNIHAKINYAKKTLRRTFCKTKLYNDALAQVKSILFGTNKDGESSKKYNVLYRCAKCGKDYIRKKVQVDHIIPVGTAKNMDEYVELLYCDVEGLQVLCLECHKDKTKNDKETIKKLK